MSMVRLEESLRRLGELQAPARLAEMVMDRFAVMDTPLGPFFVAWNRDGVSAVFEVRHGEESFRSWFDDRYRRPLVRSDAAPPASVLLKKAAGLETASGEPNKKKVGKVTRQQIREIAETKMPDLNARDIEAAMRMIEGTARSMGNEVG